MSLARVLNLTVVYVFLRHQDFIFFSLSLFLFFGTEIFDFQKLPVPYYDREGSTTVGAS